MDDIYNIILEETRQSFYQLENLTSYLDMKAFGIAAIDAILLPLYIGILSDFQASKLYYLPSGFFIASLIFIIFCVWFRTWDRQCGMNTISKYGKLDADDAAGQLATNYADCEVELLETYNEKLTFLKVGGTLTIIGFLVSIIILFLLAL